LGVEVLHHDIRNYVQAAYANLHLLLETTQDQETKELALAALTQTERISRCVQNVARIVRLKSASSNSLLPASMIEMVKSAIERTRMNFAARAIEVSFVTDCSAGADIVYVEPESGDILINLLANAVENAGRTAAQIEVELAPVTTERREWLRLQVDDHGRGIADELKQLLFDQAARWRVRRSGVGLAATRLLCDRIGAMITVSDRVAGNSRLGARFRVFFPRRN